MTGDAIRGGGASMLDALRCEPVRMCCGMAGTGGASTALGTGRLGPGDGSRNVRSDIDPELPLRSSCGVALRCDPPNELPTDDVDPDRFKVLLVCTSATDVGVIGRALSAAAAAAEEREAFDDRFFRKAWVAAVVAAELAVTPFNG